MDRRKQKRIMALLLLLTMMLNMVLPVSAAEETTAEDTISVRAVPEAELPESAELFAGFVERELYGYEYSTFGTAARANLNEVEQALYDALKTMIETVALNGGSTVFTLSDISGLKTSFTNTELGVSSIDETAVVRTAFEAQFNLDAIINALIEDCPFDLYWFDKTCSVDMEYSISRYGSGGVWSSVEIQDLTFSFVVSADYQADTYAMTTDVAKINKVKSNAAQVVTANASESAEDKMRAYMEYICNAVSYNDTAADDNTTPYGDPWQLIFVFDGDSSTNVVCEGYSKAFQYLCDLGGLDCISASGTMTGATGSGDHMWNVATLDGKNYLVDVTNCDTDTVGEPDLLFLVGAPYQDGGYNFDCAGQTICYECDNLGLAETNYAASEQPPVEDTISGTCGENLTWTLVDGVLTISGMGPMAEYAFEASPWSAFNESIVSVIITEGVITISTGAFEKCTELTSVSIANSVTEYSSAVFNECPKLMDVTLSAGASVVSDSMFRECRSLTSITIPDGVTAIGNGTFSGCAGLTEITLPSSIEELYPYAFSECGNLKKVTFEGDVPSIWEGDQYQYGSFDGCELIAYYPANNPTWTSDVMKNYGGTINWVASEPEDTAPFTCFTYDEKGNQIHGYYAEEDGIWYLFVPSTVSISEMSLSYTGSVADVSAGTLNKQESAVTGAFSESGDLVTLKNSAGEEYKVQVLQSGLPSVHVVLKDATLSDVHQDKDVKYKNNSVYIMDPQGTYDLAVEGSVEMKGRGNTSWQWYEKKGYQLKFDSKTSVLGMGKAKKWVLLANASDDSMMRTSLTYRMAENMDMAFVPDMEYVDLWVNGEYRGTYMIGDKVEPGSSRLDLKHDQGVIFEHDEAFYHEEDHWIFSEQLQRHFALKEIVEEEDSAIETAKTDFREAVDELVEYIRSELPSEVTLEELNQMIDVDSFIQYYLVTEYVLNREAIVTSFYWYKDGPEDVIHLGPIWDYDTCMGNDGAAYTGTSAENHPLFTYLFAIPAFYERAETLKTQYWDHLTAMDEDADVVKAMIEESAKMNYLRWDSLGKNSNKNGTKFADTFAEAVQNVQAWLKGREQAFTIRSVKMINSTVSERCDKMEIYYDDEDSGYQNVRFAVWQDTKHQSDLRWYPATRDADGLLRATADLVQHNRKGLYHIDAYAFQSDGSKRKIAAGQSYVKDIYVPDYTISADVAENCETMKITFTDINPHEDICFAVWSDVDGQDDLAWYVAQKTENGEWTYDADLQKHNSAGMYNIHVYSIAGGAYTKHAEHRVRVEKAVAPPVRVDVSENCDTMQLAFAPDVQQENIHFAVWSDVNGQDDLAWYAAQRAENGEWTYEADLQKHNSAGLYNIHVYSITAGVYTKHAEHRVHVEKAVAPPVRVDVSENCDTMQLAFAPDVQQENIHFAVWSDVNGQDDLAWYAAQKAGTGEWTYNTDLQKHNSAGLYNIHVYSITDGVYTKHAEFRVHVEKAAISPVTVTVSENCDIMQIVFDAQKQHEHVHFAVWSDVDGQDDLHWYASRKNADGQWEYTVDLKNHNSVGTYHIHVYSIDGGVYNKETERRANVEKPAVSPVTAAVSQNFASMEIVFANEEQYENIQFAVWSEEDGQDDLHWYAAQKNAEGNWVFSVDLRTHNTAGIYHIHVYSIIDAALAKQAEHRVKVEKAANGPVAITVAENKKTMEIVFKDSTQHETIHFAVWSDAGGQDDLHWYAAEKTAVGQWTYTVNLQDHPSEGIFYVHVYSISGTTYTKQFEDSIIV